MNSRADQDGLASRNAQRPDDPCGRPALISFAGRLRLSIYGQDSANSMPSPWLRSATDVGHRRGGNVLRAELGMSGPSHEQVRSAALALLSQNQGLTKNAGQFLGQIAVDRTPLTPNQADWLDKLLARIGMPGMVGERQS